MTAKKLIVIGYEDIGLKLLDQSTMRTTDHFGKPVFTDVVKCIYSDGSYIWALDTDSSLAVYTADLVLLSRIDIGYNSTQISYLPKAFHVSGDYLYILTKRNYGNAVETATQNQLCIRKLNKLTLAQVGEVYIDDPVLWDGSNSSANSNLIKWTEDSVWVPNYSSEWKKINIETGLVTDTWNAGPAGEQCKLTNDESYQVGPVKLFGNINEFATTLQVANFTDKSFTTVSYDVVAAAVAAGGMFNQADIWANGFNTGNFKNTVKYDSVTNTIRGIITWELSDSTTQVNDTNYMKAVIVTIDLNDSSVTFSPVVSFENILTHDSAEKSMIPRYFNTMRWTSEVSENIWILGDEYDGFALVNFATNEITVTGEYFMQGYSSDGPYVGSVYDITVDQTTITGTVTNNGTPVANRKVFLYDELSGEKIDSTTTNGSGVYSLSKNTSRKAYVVSAGASDSENFKINAHL